MTVGLSLGADRWRLIRRGGGAAWTTAALFADGQQGVWLDPSDLSTVFQDAAGTTAAGVGDPVGLMLDKSGNGRHASQPTDAQRPILRQDANGRYYLEFDGVDDFLAYDGNFLVGTSYTFALAMARGENESVAGDKDYLLGGTDAVTNGNLIMGYRDTDGLTFSQYSNDLDVPALDVPNQDQAKIILGDLDTTGRGLWVNGALLGTTPNTAQLISYSGSAFGRDRTEYFHGSMFGGVLVNAALSDPDRQRLEHYLASLAGVQL